ncbi:MAG TPA: DUF2721 domain-containing protein [Steroidobacteraceae bacterium]
MDIVHLIQSAVAPVFLLSGVGVTLGVLTTRLARIVDRARALEQSIAAGAVDAQSSDRYLQILAKRARYINMAISLCTVSALLVALVVVGLFAHSLLQVNLAMTIAVFFAASMLCLTAALLVFLIEVRLATASLRFGGRSD